MLIGILIYFVIGLIIFMPRKFEKNGIILVDSIIPATFSYLTWMLLVIIWPIIILENIYKKIRRIFFK